MSIFVGARDLNGLVVGAHQFIVITYRSAGIKIEFGNSYIQSRAFGYDTYGIVIGAQNRSELVVEAFERADLTATKEYFGAVETKWYKSDYDAQLVKADFGETPELEAKRRVLSRINNYILNQTVDPINYPTLGFGVNSNSWVQSVLKYAGGKVDTNMKGLDLSHNKAIPRTYFEPICPVKRRVRVN